MCWYLLQSIAIHEQQKKSLINWKVLLFEFKVMLFLFSIQMEPQSYKALTYKILKTLQKSSVRIFTCVKVIIADTAAAGSFLLIAETCRTAAVTQTFLGNLATIYLTRHLQSSWWILVLLWSESKFQKINIFVFQK